MTNIELYRKKLEEIARKVQKAYLDIQLNLQNNTLNKSQQAAIKSLPHDVQTGAAKNRIIKFPNDCCMDASVVLAIILRQSRTGTECGISSLSIFVATQSEKLKL